MYACNVVAYRLKTIAIRSIYNPKIQVDFIGIFGNNHDKSIVWHPTPR